MSSSTEEPPGRAWSWRRLPLALAILYVPQLLPLFAGPLTECDHCIASFWRFFVIIPGKSVVVMWGDLGWLGFAAAAALTIAILVVLVWVLGRRGAWRWVVASGVAGLSAANSMGFASALRDVGRG